MRIMEFKERRSLGCFFRRPCSKSPNTPNAETRDDSRFREKKKNEIEFRIKGGPVVDSKMCRWAGGRGVQIFFLENAQDIAQNARKNAPA